jgi:hypothetical protein
MADLQTIQASIAKINELTKDELDTLQGDVVALFDQYDGEETTPENVTVLQELGQAITAIMGRSEEIAATEAEAESNKEAARAIRAQIDADKNKEKGKEVVDEKEGADVVTDPSAGDNIDQPVAVVASTRIPAGASRMGRAVTGITPVSADAPRAELVAGGYLPSKVQGTKYEDRWDLAETMCDTLRGLHRGQSHGNVIVASANYRPLYPEDRTLRAGDFKGNEAKFDNATSPRALVATGGICSPLNIDYSLPTWATADRPFKAGLAQFQADRGGLTYRNPPTVAALAGATSIWTEATDANPQGATKPVISIACEGPVTVYVDAVPTRLGFGNLMGQFDPDTIAANTDLAVAAAARIAEVNLLNKLQAACTLGITSAAVLGASRTWFATIDQLTANFRYTHRLNEDQALTIVLPAWVKSMLRQDRVLELAHDSSGMDPFQVPDSWIDDTLAVRNIKAIWTLDAIGANAGGGTNGTQVFTPPAATTAVPAYPTTVVWNIYIEGSIQFLDGGLLNLGVVRDSTLDATNDYETFVETFEGLAYRGFSGGALQVISTMHPTGSSSATVTVS